MGSIIFRAPAGEVPAPPFHVSRLSSVATVRRWSCLPAPLGTPNPGIPPLPPSLAATTQRAPSVPAPSPGLDPDPPSRHSRPRAAAPPQHPNSQAGHELSIPISTAQPGFWGAPHCPPTHSAVLALGCSARLLSRCWGPGPEMPWAGCKPPPCPKVAGPSAPAVPGIILSVTSPGNKIAA